MERGFHAKSPRTELLINNIIVSSTNATSNSCGRIDCTTRKKAEI
jgi:hypothetical protein